MSRLIDKFQNAAQSSTQPMGFRTSRAAAPEPGILVIVSATPEEAGNAGDIGNAAAFLIRPNDLTLTAKNFQKIAETLPDVPIGLYLEDAGDAEIAALTEAGCDFLVFPASSRFIAAPTGKKSGRILQVESSMDDSLLRAGNSLPVDAFLAADTFSGGSLSWHELMIIQHLANTLARPLILNLPPDATEAELKALYEAGVDGGLVEISALKPGGLKKLQDAIGKLPPRSARKRGKIDVFLPRAGGEPAAAPPPDEEEEEDE
ncbi:MAG: hypothetical protein ABR958_03735 [Dehalococcoidales bacterium]